MISAAGEGWCWESCGNHSVDIRHYYTHLMIPWHDTTQLILAELTLRDLVMVEVRAGMIDRLLLGWWAGLSCEYLVQRHAVVGWSLAGAHTTSSAPEHLSERRLLLESSVIINNVFTPQQYNIPATNSYLRMTPDCGLVDLHLICQGDSLVSQFAQGSFLNIIANN